MITPDFIKGFIKKKFYSSKVNRKEFEDILKEAIVEEHPNDPIVDFQYDEKGIEIALDSGQEIYIEIDWDEFVLS